MIDKSGRKDGTFERADFTFDAGVGDGYENTHACTDILVADAGIRHTRLVGVDLSVGTV